MESKTEFIRMRNSNGESVRETNDAQSVERKAENSGKRKALRPSVRKAIFKKKLPLDGS